MLIRQIPVSSVRRDRRLYKYKLFDRIRFEEKRGDFSLELFTILLLSTKKREKLKSYANSFLKELDQSIESA